MATSAHTTEIAGYNDQPGVIGKLRSVRATITFGADYAAADLPVITAAELGLAEVVAVIPEGSAGGPTDPGATVVAVIASGGASFTLSLWDGTTAIGTVDESDTTQDILVLGH